MFVSGGGSHHNRPLFLKMNEKPRNNDFKRISELIDTYYPELAKRLKNGKRNANKR